LLSVRGVESTSLTISSQWSCGVPGEELALAVAPLAPHGFQHGLRAPPGRFRSNIARRITKNEVVRVMQRFMSTLLGPVFAKEMVEIARRKRYYLNRVLYGVALFFVFFIVYENRSWRFRTGGKPSIHEMAELAEALFNGVSILQYGAIYLLIPLFVCGVIAGEREEQTLELLFATRLRNREIVLGKLVSRIVVLGLLTLAALPLMSIIMFFGGIAPEAIWKVLSATFLGILFAGAHAIYFSTVTKGPIGALVRTYWWMAVWIFGVPLALMIPASAIARFGNAPGIIYALLTLYAYINPLGSFVAGISSEAYNALARYVGAWFFPTTFVLPGAWSVFLIWRAVARLRASPIPFALLVSRVPVVSRLRERRRLRLERKRERRRQRAERLWFGLPVRNPLWLRSRRARIYDREGYIERIQKFGWCAAIGFFLLFVFFERRPLFERGFGLAFLVPAWIGAAALTAIFSATSLVGDRRRGFLELVLLTPLTAREIVDGTLLSVWRHLRPIRWLIVAISVTFCATFSFHPLGALLSLVTAVLFCTLLAVFGTACSLAARTLPGALVPTFLFVVLVNVGTPFLMVIFPQAGGPVLWVLSALALCAGWFWIRRSASAAAVGTYLIGVHLALASLATCWTFERWTHHEEFPIAAMHPGFLALILLAETSARWRQELPAWDVIVPSYWGLLVVNIVCARWWLIRNFERLAGRTLPIVPGNGAPLSVAATRLAGYSLQAGK
jgi:ABC-type transport system involved in multi-copper enzyme maturation permease subunit